MDDAATAERCNIYSLKVAELEKALAGRGLPTSFFFHVNLLA